MKFEILHRRRSLYGAEEIALIHSHAYSENHFTSGFSLEKLIEYNQSLIDSSDITVLAIENGKVLGFIIAGCNLPTGVSEFVKHNRLWLAFRLAAMPNILTAKISDRIRSWFEPHRASLAEFRLLSIAVAPEAQSKGVGLDILRFFERELLLRDVKCYGLSVKNKNLRALSFYERNGFVKENESSGSSYYCKKL